ncbi:MAG: flagellar motor switch protein FliN [Leptospira sp.]|nr:flagellar motor switch protein FliN [Leptospira sp.]
MADGSLSAEDIDALLSGGPSPGAGTESGGGGGDTSISSTEMSDLDSLLGGGSSSSSAPSFDAVAAALGPSTASSPAPRSSSSSKPSGGGGGASNTANLSLLMDVTMSLTVELGRTNMAIKDVLQLSEGAVVELDKTVGEELDLLVNGKAIGKGKIIIIDDFYGVQITQIIDPMQRLKDMSF